MRKIEIAIVGASGLVGEKIIEVLKEENLFEMSNLTLYVSENSKNQSCLLYGKRYKYNILNNDVKSKQFDIVFFSAGEEISRSWAKIFSDNGAFVIDNSNAFRKDKNIPLVVPEINIEIIDKYKKIISNPNCSTIQLALVVNIINKIYEIEKIVVSTYQSVSGAGKKALEDLYNNTNFEIKNGIKDNVIPQIGEISESGFCEEENKIMFELNKILRTNISICANTVRVPVPFCHTESVYIKFKNKICLEKILSKLKENGICIDNLSLSTEIKNTNLTHVCRIRQFSENEISLFIVADNLRRGAAYNAVLIAKYIIFKYLIN